MTKRVQFIGHDSATANAFVGEDREITVDYENWGLRLHDNATPGGHIILNRDQNDDRYQARSDELDGFLDWEPSDRGFLVRLGPSNYKLRTFEFDDTVFSLENPFGFEGNPTLGLQDNVTKDITFSGAIKFTEEIDAEGGLKGNLTGNVTGDVDGNLTGNVDGDVTGDLTGNSTGTHTGSLDTREGTVQMAPGQIDLDWLSDEILAFITNKVVPIGGCIPYFGAVADIPLNWAICDGTNGTPNLANGRGVVGAGASFPLGSQGGSFAHTHGLNIAEGGAHTHSGTVGGTSLTEAQLPKHRFKDGVTHSSGSIYCYGTTPAEPSTGRRIDGNSGTGTVQGWTNFVGNDEPHTHPLTTDAGGAHSHTGSTLDGSSLSPYVAANWIMRLS